MISLVLFAVRQHWEYICRDVLVVAVWGTGKAYWSVDCNNITCQCKFILTQEVSIYIVRK